MSFTKTGWPTPEGGYPELQLTLITDKLRAEGPDPLVYVFYQLAGGRDKNNQDGPPDPFSLFFGSKKRDNQQSKPTEHRRMTHSINRITAELTDEGVVFKSNAKLIIDVNFPSVLMRLLPVSKGMAERQGSASIAKVVERDIGPALDKLRSLYLEWTSAP